MFNKNRHILDSQLSKVNDWDNDNGDDFGDDAFSMDDAFSNDDYNEAAGGKRRAVRAAVSMPYIFTVTSTSLLSETVVLFGSEKNRTQLYAGNPSTISITYDFTGYYGGGTTGYVALIGRTESAPLTFGRIRLECANTVQLSAPVNVSDYDPTGKTTSYPIVNFKKLNQFDQNAIESETDMIIYGGTELSYNQLALTTCRWFFYPADIACLKSGLKGKGVVKELRRPDTYLQETVRLTSASGQTLR